MAQDYIPNESVKFTGFAEGQDQPDNADNLVEGDVYVILKVEEETVDGNVDHIYTLEAPNQNFDDSKRVTKKNPETVTVEVFGDEIERYEEEEEEEEKTPARSKAPAKKKAAPKAKAKAKTKAKPKAKAKAKTKAPAKKKVAAKKKAAAKSERKEHEADPDLKGLIILTDEEEDQEILDLVAEAEDIVELAQDLVEDNANTEWRLGGVLYHARVGKDYKEYADGKYGGTGGWADFCEEVLGLEYRKAQYLVEIYTTFLRFGKGAEDLANIGWSAAIQITRHMDEDNVDQLMDMAEDQSVRDLKESIKTSFKTKTSNKVVTKMVRFNFVMEESAAEHTRELFAQIKEQMDVETDNQCFEQIVSEYAQSNLDVAAIKKATRAAKARAKSKTKPKAKVKAKAAPKAKAKVKTSKRKAA